MALVLLVLTTRHPLSYTRPVAGTKKPLDLDMDAGRLDRTSFVPLYYQLQEVLKEQIESGVWRPGQTLPSEPALARGFGVSRVVIRQALAILQDDRQIVRVKGRGTFVAEPKLEARAGGLSRLLVSPRPRDVSIETLDVCCPRVDDSIRRELGATPDEEILRITTLQSLRATPLSIGYSFFRRAEVGWLESVAADGRALPRDLVLADHGIELVHSRVAIETSQCGRFEADRFGIAHRAPVFLVLCSEFRRDHGEVRPFEAARVEYRGDLVQIRLEVSERSAGEMEAVWQLTDPAYGPDPIIAAPGAPVAAR